MLLVVRDIDDVVGRDIDPADHAELVPRLKERSVLVKDLDSRVGAIADENAALGVDGDCTGEVCSIPHDKIAEATSSPTPEMTRLAMFNEGVDMMGGIGFMVSAVHENDQIDRTAEAFERALGALREEQIV